MDLSIPRGHSGPVEKGEVLVIYNEAASGILAWTKGVLVQNAIPKVGVGFMMAWVVGFQEVAVPPMALALGFWFLDFVMGVLRAVADPEVKLSTQKAARGALKPIVIMVLALTAFGIEEVIHLSSGLDLAGKVVMAVMVGIVWEECVSIQTNGSFFFRRIEAGFRGAKKILMGGKDGDG